MMTLVVKVKHNNKRCILSNFGLTKYSTQMQQDQDTDYLVI